MPRQRSPNPKTSPLPTPPTQKTIQPLSQHASSLSVGHMNMPVFAITFANDSRTLRSFFLQKPNRLHSLTFDFPSPKLRISVNSIIPATRYLITRSLKNKRIPFENAWFRKKPSPTRSSVPRWGAASFLFRNLRPFPSRRLFCIVCRHIPPSWPCIHAPHHALSWTNHCVLVVSNSRIIVGN